jgi:hypothetical protein
MMKMIFRLAILLICSMVCLAGCNGGGGDNGGNGDMPPPLGETYPIDGVVDLSDFDMVYERDPDCFSRYRR